MTIAVVILNYNTEAMLRRFLPTVVAHSARHDTTIVVADNASTDGSVAYVSSTFPQVRLVRLTENYGFAEGYNRALAPLAADYFVLLNSDVLVARDWLAPLVAFMEAHPAVAAVQPKILKYALADGKGTAQRVFEYAGAAGGFIDKWGYPYCRGRLLTTVENDEGQYDRPQEVEWASGACLMLRAADYRRAGGMDSKYFAHQEEIDLCWRLRIAGKRIFCVPASTVWHVGGATLAQGDPRKEFLNYRNNLATLYKNLPPERVATVLRWRALLDNMAALAYLLTGQRSRARAVWRGRKAFAAWRNELSEQRKEVQSCRLLPPSRDTQALSLLWQYYVRRRRTWQQLPAGK